MPLAHGQIVVVGVEPPGQPSRLTPGFGYDQMLSDCQ